jgi:hypothetical protein
MILGLLNIIIRSPYLAFKKAKMGKKFAEVSGGPVTQLYIGRKKRTFVTFRPRGPAICYSEGPAGSDLSAQLDNSSTSSLG